MLSKQPLSALEQEVMNVVWSRPGVTAADIQAALLAKRALKDSTIRTVLTRLEEKRYVTHAVDGRTFVYSSVEPPTKIAVRGVKQIIDRFCRGSVESLLVGMVADEVVDADELRRIVKRLRSQAKGKTK